MWPARTRKMPAAGLPAVPGWMRAAPWVARLHAGTDDAVRVAALCQAVENRIVGAPCGIMDQVACCAGQSNTLLRLVCLVMQTMPRKASQKCC